jgi:hypothetical protein
MGAMGERFVLWRVGVEDRLAQAGRALAHAGREHTMRRELADAVAGLFVNGVPYEPPELSADDRERLIVLATFAVRCRSGVERDGYSRDIELVPDAEAPGRFVKVLARLFAGVHAIGADTATAWAVVAKAALDSIPALRLAAVRALTAGERSTTVVAKLVGYPTQTARRALEDLHAHEVVDRHPNGQGKTDTWTLSQWASDQYAFALSIFSVNANRSRNVGRRTASFS